MEEELWKGSKRKKILRGGGAEGIGILRGVSYKILWIKTQKNDIKPNFLSLAKTLIYFVVLVI